MVHALDIYEIRLHIGRYLPQSTLIVCSLVSKHWRETFFPLVWEHISLDAYRLRRPSTRILNRYASYIRSLKYRGFISTKHYDFPFQPKESICALNTLHFQHGERKAIDYYWHAIVKSIYMHQSTLKTLCIEDVGYSPPNFFWNMISTHNHQLDDGDENQPECDEIWSQSCSGLSPLRHLMLSIDETIYSSEWCRLLSGCQNLQSLDLRLLKISSSLKDELNLKYNLRHWPVLAVNSHFIHIQDLSLHLIRNLNSRICLRAIISQCPGLRSLSWRINKCEGFPVREFSNMAIAGSWKYLESLEIWGSQVRIDDRNLAKALRCWPKLQRVCVKGSNAGSITSSFLLSGPPVANYTMTICDLNFLKCENITSRMVHEFLTTFPNLIHFRANKIDIEEALLDVQWVCTKLKTLCLYFDLGDRSNSWSPHYSHRWEPSPDLPNTSYQIIYLKLAKMTQLETLDTQRYFPSRLLNQWLPPCTIYYRECTIGYRLEEGLELLASMKNLRELYIQGLNLDIQSEFEWMKDNWPEIQLVEVGWSRSTSGLKKYFRR